MIEARSLGVKVTGRVPFRGFGGKGGRGGRIRH